ncbi:MAG: hypothetical protein HYS41_04590 [Candidatus Omnitrophica bacterium]|nr:hypothetical protein [Candidatus Omnitrophota bacterium]
MKLMEKRILVNLPVGLYEGLKRMAQREYQSVSSIIRESILRRMEEVFTPKELKLIEQGRKAFHEGKGRNWRDVRRG